MADINYLDREWVVMEQEQPDGTTLAKVVHYCGGKNVNPMTGKELQEGETHLALRKWFHPTKNWNEIPICDGCEAEVPEQTIMMVKLKNADLFSR